MKQRIHGRRYTALRRCLIAAAAMLLVNQATLLGMVLPIQSIRAVEEREGAPHGVVLARRWEPKFQAARLYYLTASENAVVLADTSLSVYGWMPGFGNTIDCTKREPLFASVMYFREKENWFCYVFGCVEDPSIARVEIRFGRQDHLPEDERFVFHETDRLAAEGFMERNGKRYFLLRKDLTDWPDDIPVRIYALGLDSTGAVAVELNLEDTGQCSYYG